MVGQLPGSAGLGLSAPSEPRPPATAPPAEDERGPLSPALAASAGTRGILTAFQLEPWVLAAARSPVHTELGAAWPLQPELWALNRSSESGATGARCLELLQVGPPGWVLIPTGSPGGSEPLPCRPRPSAAPPPPPSWNPPPAPMSLRAKASGACRPCLPCRELSPRPPPRPRPLLLLQPCRPPGVQGAILPLRAGHRLRVALLSIRRSILSCDRTCGLLSSLADCLVPRSRLHSPLPVSSLTFALATFYYKTIHA